MLRPRLRPSCDEHERDVVQFGSTVANTNEWNFLRVAIALCTTNCLRTAVSNMSLSRCCKLMIPHSCKENLSENPLRICNRCSMFFGCARPRSLTVCLHLPCAGQMCLDFASHSLLVKGMRDAVRRSPLPAMSRLLVHSDVTEINPAQHHSCMSPHPQWCV